SRQPPWPSCRPDAERFPFPRRSMEFVAVVGVVAVAALLWLGWQKYMAPLAEKQQEEAEAAADRQRAAYEGLRRADPGFEMETFLQRAEMAFLMVKRAYQDRDVQ